jgi:hypothetical protein
MEDNMPEERIDEEIPIEEMSGKTITMSLLIKLGSGTILLAVIGYAASWAFMTLNTLQEGVTKNTETLQMIKEDVQKDRQDKAQWTRIASNYDKITENEIEIRVLKEMVKFYVDQMDNGVEVKNPKEDIPFGPVKPHKLDRLFEEFMDNKKKKPVDPNILMDNSMQQMQQRISP